MRKAPSPSAQRSEAVVLRMSMCHRKSRTARPVPMR
jgi:hypothetical protein